MERIVGRRGEGSTAEELAEVRTCESEGRKKKGGRKIEKRTE